MNITPQVNNLPLATVVNPPTDTLRRENNQREVISQPSAAGQSAAERGLARDREARPNSNNVDNIDFAAIQEQAEQEAARINGSEQNQQDSAEQQGQAFGQNADETDNRADGSQDDEQRNSGDSDEPNPQQEFAEQQQILELQARDREVRAHEQAHAAVGGPYAGTPQYTFETGPDGRRYAVEGEVQVDLSTVDGNPRATIAKLQQVYAAALAPANPSIQDTRVAAQAQQLIAQAQSELVAQQTGAEAPEQNNPNIRANQVLGETQVAASGTLENSSEGFDQLINRTIAAQDQVVPDLNTRSLEITERAARIETFYANINQAFERPPRFQFEITA